MEEEDICSLQLFRRQVLQLLPLPDLSWPELSTLRKAISQEWLYSNLFDPKKTIMLPSERHQLLVLKPLVAKIEASITDPEEDVRRNFVSHIDFMYTSAFDQDASSVELLYSYAKVSVVHVLTSSQEISDALMSTLAELMFTPLPSEADAAQQKGWVTYVPLLTQEGSEAARSHPNPESSTEPVLKLKESRSVISGAGTTGLRTWEAALHLASYMCATPSARSTYITGKHVLELGAGTGFLSILCSKHLGAAYVTATDGDEGVVDALKENLFHNDAEDSVSAGVMRWGWSIKDSIAEFEAERRGGLHTVIGADVTYDKTVIPALVGTIRSLFERWPAARVLISATIRNENTFSAFEIACRRNQFNVEEIEFPLIDLREQRCLFHSTSVPIRILEIKAPSNIKDPFAV